MAITEPDLPPKTNTNDLTKEENKPVLSTERKKRIDAWKSQGK